jgi:phosphoglycerol transferase MdoB-like AlkP superfamily enzyme
MTEHPEKYHQLPSLTQDLNKEGYRSSFYFGGQLIYGNIKSYIMYNQFHKIVEGDDFSSSIPRGKLGVHDEYLFNRHIEDMKTEPEPFFSAMFTLSSHSPYDQPVNNKITRNVPEIDFVNSAWYTDYALGKYIESARKQPWYGNTLFILVADHSHVSHHQNPLQSFAYHRIPMLWFGPALRPEFKGKKVDMISSQTDLPATLLKQLGLNANLYPWSKNLFNPYTPPFAYFEMNDGLGWKNPSGYFIYNKLEDRFMDKKIAPADEPKTVKEGKSYLQEVFREFLSY